MVKTLIITTQTDFGDLTIEIKVNRELVERPDNHPDNPNKIMEFEYSVISINPPVFTSEQIVEFLHNNPQEYE